MMTELGSAPATATHSVTLTDYAKVSAIFAAFGALLVYVTRSGAASPQPTAAEVIQPVLALVSLTALVWLIMVVVRNATVLRGISSPSYYATYSAGATPPDWVERPARTFNNLFQTPVLLYALIPLMLVTQHVDRVQVQLAWLYVLVRAVHAVVYIAWNSVPYRFAAWICSCLTLGTLWVRFASQL